MDELVIKLQGYLQAVADMNSHTNEDVDLELALLAMDCDLVTSIQRRYPYGAPVQPTLQPLSDWKMIVATRLEYWFFYREAFFYKEHQYIPPPRDFVEAKTHCLGSFMTMFLALLGDQPLQVYRVEGFTIGNLDDIFLFETADRRWLLELAVND